MEIYSSFFHTTTLSPHIVHAVPLVVLTAFFLCVAMDALGKNNWATLGVRDFMTLTAGSV